MSSLIVGKSKFSYAFLEMSYFPDLGKPGVVGVPNPTLRETRPELFKPHKVGRVPVKTERTATSYRHLAVIARSNVITADAEGSQSQGLRHQGA